MHVKRRFTYDYSKKIFLQLCCAVPGSICLSNVPGKTSDKSPDLEDQGSSCG